MLGYFLSGDTHRREGNMLVFWLKVIFDTMVVLIVGLGTAVIKPVLEDDTIVDRFPFDWMSDPDMREPLHVRVIRKNRL